MIKLNLEVIDKYFDMLAEPESLSRKVLNLLLIELQHHCKATYTDEFELLMKLIERDPTLGTEEEIKRKESA
jgi:hypothetical protein